jgi:hypothetical protein
MTNEAEVLVALDKPTAIYPLQQRLYPQQQEHGTSTRPTHEDARCRDGVVQYQDREVEPGVERNFAARLRPNLPAASVRLLNADHDIDPFVMHPVRSINGDTDGCVDLIRKRPGEGVVAFHVPALTVWNDMELYEGIGRDLAGPLFERHINRPEPCRRPWARRA